MTKTEEIKKLKAKVRWLKKEYLATMNDYTHSNMEWASQKVVLINQVKELLTLARQMQTKIDLLTPTPSNNVTNDIINYRQNTIISNPEVAVDRCSDCNCSKRCK